MKIALLAAMDKEMALLKNIIENPREVTIDGTACITGTIASHDVLLAKCGIGKVNAAINTYKIIRAFSPELVINSGVAGGAGLKIGSLLIADAVAYHDVWCGPGTEWGTADGFGRFLLPSPLILNAARADIKDPQPCFGLIATGDTFISKAEEIERIHRIFPQAVAVDMESAAIAQTCVSLGVGFGIIRVVSDTPGEGENIEQYKDFWSTAPQKTFKAIEKIIKNI